MKLYGIDERDTVCANCKHYEQHYVEGLKEADIEPYVPILWGHCRRTLKTRRAEDVCPRFSYREPFRETDRQIDEASDTMRKLDDKIIDELCFDIKQLVKRQSCNADGKEDRDGNQN